MNNFHEFFKLLFVAFRVAVYLYLSNFCQSTKCSQSVTEKLINLVNNTAVRYKSKFKSQKLFKKFNFSTLICINKPLRITLAPNVDHFKRNFAINLRLIILISNAFFDFLSVNIKNIVIRIISKMNCHIMNFFTKIFCSSLEIQID